MKKLDKKIWKMAVSYRQIKIVIILICLMCFGAVKLNGTTPLLNDFTITFDWDIENYNQDAIPVYSDIDSIRQNPNIFEFAYIINTTPSVKITIDSDCNDDFILLIDAKVTEGTGFDICYRNYNYTHTTGNFYFDVPIPHYVSKMNYSWEWIITAIPICGTSSAFSANTLSKTTEQHLFIILDEPNAPMETPWASVLNYACDWASGETTVNGVTTEITSSLYVSGFYYNASGAAQYGYSFSLFFLTDFLFDIGYSKSVNCLDMAKAVTTFGNALGAVLILTRFHSDLGENVKFPLNYIDPIGSTPATNNTFSYPLIGNDCRTGGFIYHAFAENINHYVWDATLRYDTDNNPDNVSNSNPYCGDSTTGEDWELPCYITRFEYLIGLVDEWTKYNDDFIIDCSDPTDCGYFSTNVINVE